MMERENKGDVKFNSSKTGSSDFGIKAQSFISKLEKRLRKTRAGFRKLICDHPFWDEDRVEAHPSKNEN